jgi:hypothetical protein
MSLGSMRVFELRHGEVIVGVLRETGGDFPWLHCSFEPTEAFAEYRPLFERLERSVEQSDMAVADDLFGIIQDQLQLVEVDDPDLIGKFLLHIDGNSASFRFLTKEESQDWDDDL